MTVYIVELEPVETRYTKQWKQFLPSQMLMAGLPVEVIEGPSDAPQDTTPGAFLNFSGTNYWKSEQLKTISQMFAAGKIKDGDYFLYTDAWNPTILQLKYMAELLGIKIMIGGMWHAGPELLTVLQACPDETAVLLDLYETPVRIDVRELELAVQQRWQEQMNAWLVEHEELNKQR